MNKLWDVLIKRLKRLKYSFKIKFDRSLDIDINKSKMFIESLGIPKNNFERSFFQFYSGRSFKSNIENFISDLISILSLPILCLLIGVKTFISKNEKRTENYEYDAVYISNTSNNGIMPIPLLKKYKIVNVPFAEGLLLNSEDIRFIKRAFKYGSYNPTFAMKSIVNVSNYCYIIKRYNPKVIITAYESSFTSSLLTEYCNGQNIKHINIMHGEKLFKMNTTFFCFDEFYIWDEYYIELFSIEKAKVNNYYLYNPWIRDCIVDKKDLEKVDLKFYLAIETKETFSELKCIIEKIQSLGLSVKIRLHPIGTFDKLALKLFKEDIIEDRNKINIIESLNETTYVVARYSTVLFQGYSMGKNILIDDVTNTDIYNKLNNLNYIMLNKKHQLLSAFLEKS